MPSTKPAPPRPKSARPPKSGRGKAVPKAQDNAERRGLELFLRQRTGFHFALALYNDPLERAACVQELAASLAAEKIELRIIDLLQPSPARTLLEHVEAAARTTSPDQRLALVILNLESRVDYNPELHQPGSPGLEFLATANLHRELFEKSCPFPIVLWMTELLERALVKQAPDLWQWRSHVFDLRTRERPLETLTEPDGRRLKSDDDRLHPEIRLHRLEEELVAYRKSGSRVDEMRILNAIGLAHSDAGDAKLARNDFEEVLRIARELRNPQWEGNALGNLGGAYALLGDIQGSIKYHEQALELSRKIGDRDGESSDLGNLGVAYKNLGDLDKAIDLYNRQLVIAREIGHRQSEGSALGNLGNAYRIMGDPHKAINFYKQRLVMAREDGDRRAEGDALGGLGNVYITLGDLRESVRLYEQQLDFARETGDRRGEATALGNLGLAYSKLGDQLEAIARVEAAMAIFKAIEDPNAAIARGLLAEWRG
jgi:tetratricopeptide (TPR) repeat protein